MPGNPFEDLIEPEIPRALNPRAEKPDVMTPSEFLRRLSEVSKLSVEVIHGMKGGEVENLATQYLPGVRIIA